MVENTVRAARRYAIIGVGGVGGFLGVHLVRSGAEVHFLLHSDFAHVQAHGLTLTGASGEHHLPSVHAYHDAANMPPCDVVLVTLKSTQMAVLASILPQVMKPDGVVVTLQNGLGAEAAAAQWVGAEHIIGGSCVLAAQRVGPGKIHHIDLGSLTLGPYQTPMSALVAHHLPTLVTDLQAAHIPTTTTDSVQHARWQKLVWNVPYNGLSVVLDTTTQAMMHNPDTRRLIEELMHEIVTGAQAVGILLPAQLPATMLAFTDTMQDYSTSMKADYDAGRPLEVEAIVGAPYAAAQAAGVHLPRLSVLYAQLKYIDARARLGKAGAGTRGRAPKESLGATEVVLRFLESVGRRSDAEFYLSLFRAEAKERFATLCVDGPVIDDALDAVALDLRFLTSLGLFPVVVVGLFDADMSATHAELLLQGLTRVGVAARLLEFGDTYVTAVRDATRDGVLPVVSMGPTADASESARTDALIDLSVALQTRKVIFLQRRGGLRQDGHLVPLVNLGRDFDQFADSPELSSKQKTIVATARKLLCERASQKATVAIASPLELLRELFTVRGAGTLLRRGARIRSSDSLQQIDVPRLRDLLTSAFGRQVDMGFFNKPVSRIYYDEDYRGAAVLIDTPLGMYLSKFAVEREAQGEGIGGDLWQVVTQHATRLFWRSRGNNPIDRWYTKECDSMVRLPEWNIFLKGFAPEHIADAVAYARQQPADFPAVSST